MKKRAKVQHFFDICKHARIFFTIYYVTFRLILRKRFGNGSRMVRERCAHYLKNETDSSANKSVINVRYFARFLRVVIEWLLAGH